MKKKLIVIAISLLLNATSFAQSFEGVVKYNRVNDPSKMFANNPNADRMRAQFGNMAEQMRRPVIFELTVKNDEAVFKADPKQEAGETSFEVNGQRRSFPRRLPKDEVYYNLATKKFKKYEEYAQQPFQLAGEIEAIRWKVDPMQTRQVLGYECMMATATEKEKRMIFVPNESGQGTMKDTIMINEITAWFTDAIPTNAGPDKYSGLPGLVLALDINNGVTTFVATHIDKKTVSADDLKINSKGKKVTAEQLQKVKDDHMAEMRKNFRGGGGGGQMMIMGGRG
jgi:GLPGLI family protein